MARWDVGRGGGVWGGSYAAAVPEFVLNPAYTPTADQPQAIESLAAGVEAGDRFMTLLGATGTGKTFTMAGVIQTPAPGAGDRA